jgi:endonuclease III
MSRETQAELRKRVEQILGLLASTYPEAHCELHFRNPLELLIATILSAQCTDKQVNIVTADLFQKYRSASDYADASPEDLEQDLRRIGLYRNKAKNIRAACQALVEHHGGEVPRSLSALVALDGVGRKTANVVLGNAFGIEEGVVVDTHVARLSGRLGITREKDPVKIEKRWMTLVPRDRWSILSHWLIWHGRRRCGARKPDCEGCEIRHLCPSAPGEVKPSPPGMAAAPKKSKRESPEPGRLIRRRSTAGQVPGT